MQILFKFIKKPLFINILISILIGGLSYYSLMLIASNYGGTLESDMYFLLISLIALFSGFINSLYIVVMLPTFIDLISKGEKKKAADFVGIILILSFTLLIPIIALSYIKYDKFFQIVTKYSTLELNEGRNILCLFGPLLFITITAEFFRVLVMATYHYIAATICGLFPPLFVIFSIIYFKNLNGENLSLALIISKILTAFIMMHIVFNIEKISFLNIKIDRVLILVFFKKSAPYILATMITNYSIFYFDYMATGLSVGILSSISYAQKIFGLPSTIIFTPILEISRIKFAKGISSNDSNYLKSMHNNTMQLLLYISIPIAFLMYFFPEQIISSFFKGDNFSDSGVQVAAVCLSIYSISLPFNVIFMLNGRLIESYQKLIWPSIFGSVGQLISIAITFFLVEKNGYIGIPLSKILIDIFYFTAFSVIALILFGFKIDITNLKNLFSVSIPTSLGLIILYKYFFEINNQSLNPYNLFSLVILGAVFFIIYTAFVLLFDRKFFLLLSK